MTRIAYAGIGCLDQLSEIATMDFAILRTKKPMKTRNEYLKPSMKQKIEQVVESSNDEA